MFTLCAIAACSTQQKSQPAQPLPAPVASVVTAAAVPLRRLSKEEYNNTVRDLLGDTTRPADSFSPDDVMGGFENNTVSPVSQAHVERYLSAAEAVAAGAVQRLDRVAPCEQNEAKDQCAKRFVEKMGRRIYRRSLDENEKTALFDLWSDKASRSDYAKGVALVLQAMLQSPKFLYRIEPLDDKGSLVRPLSGYELATRLSYFLWASTPDDLLLDEAEQGALNTLQGIQTAARRMLKDTRANDGIRSFYRQWLDLRKLETESKDTALYPNFSRELKDSMTEETLLFSVKTVNDGGDVVKGLLTSNKTFVNAQLATLYGVNSPNSSGFSQVLLPREQRAGLLTQASVMTVNSNADQGSVILRGKFIRERILCQVVPPPPPNVVNNPPKFDPTLTRKQQNEMHQKDPSCSGCHSMMDPIGFGFENYDAIGAWHATEAGKPIDSKGTLSGTGDTDGAFEGAVALGERLSTSAVVRRCMATQWFRAALGRVEEDKDNGSLDTIFASLSKGGYEVKELMLAIVTSDAFRHTAREEESAP